MRSFHRTVSVMAALSLVVAACGDDNGGGPDNVAPTATFAAPACNQLSCQFTDGSSDSDGSIASRSWTFESGTPATSTDQNPTVVFSAAGTYTVALSVTDNEGATDDFELDVTVTGAPGNQAPTAAFTPDVQLARVHLHRRQHRRGRHHRVLSLGLRRSYEPSNTSTERARPTPTRSPS